MATAGGAEAQPRATFIFKGTVTKLRAATMKDVPVDERTVVVRVDQVLDASKNLAKLAGSDVTVQMAAGAKAAVGRAYVFHTVGWIFGDGIAVRALNQEVVASTHAALLAREGDPSQHKADRELKARVDSADLVVFGTVSAVRLPAPANPQRQALRSAGATPARPVSEHDPKWREAVVQVDSVHKGEHPGDNVTVLFPSSMDVGWYKAPKFEPGHRGYFVLHKAQIKESDRVAPHTHALLAATDADKETDTYTALSPADFQPSTQPDRIAGMIAPMTATTET